MSSLTSAWGPWSRHSNGHYREACSSSLKADFKWRSVGKFSYWLPGLLLPLLYFVFIFRSGPARMTVSCYTLPIDTGVGKLFLDKSPHHAHRVLTCLFLFLFNNETVRGKISNKWSSSVFINSYQSPCHPQMGGKPLQVTSFCCGNYC